MAHEWKEPEGRNKPTTVSGRLFWSYSNLAMAHAALKNGAVAYSPKPYYMIRSRLQAGLTKGTMKVGSLFEDERLKILSPVHCAYCGTPAPSTVDHLFPRLRGGTDNSENLVPCCAGCNSRKGALDVMTWFRKQNEFPSLSVTRRYLKLAILSATEMNLMACQCDSEEIADLPFEIMSVPMNYPNPTKLVWDMRA